VSVCCKVSVKLLQGCEWHWLGYTTCGTSFSQKRACCLFRHLHRPTARASGKVSLQARLALKWLQPAQPQAEMRSTLVVEGLQVHTTSLILTQVQPRRHSNDTIVKCHQRSQIIQDTVKRSWLSKKLISEHVHKLRFRSEFYRLCMHDFKIVQHILQIVQTYHTQL